MLNVGVTHYGMGTSEDARGECRCKTWASPIAVWVNHQMHEDSVSVKCGRHPVRMGTSEEA